MSIQDQTPRETREGQRIAKVMARAGLCSRRDAEQWIAEGRVAVNGEVLTSPAFNVSDADEVLIDGQPLASPERTRLFLFHKPRGLVTTAKDPEGRPTIFSALPEELPRVVAIGRLDINTEGLLLLTNDGGLSRVLELPATGWLRRYRVRAHGEITQEQLDGLRSGVTIDGIDYLGIEAKFERQQGSNVWLTMGLREGKNREIKRVLEHMGLSVNRLIRVAFGPFELGDLAEGEVVEVRTRVLRDQLGPKLAKQAGANFDAPVEAPEPLREEAPPPRRTRDDKSSEGPPRKRKHVSVLRAEAREEAAGPRKRISRATTSDRKGREVKVEMVSLAKRPATEPAHERRPAARRTSEGFAKSGRSEAGERRRAPGEGFGMRERAPREGAAGETRGFGRPPRRAPGEGFDKRERAPREAAGEKRSFDRPARRASGEGFEKRERAPRGAAGETRGFGRPARRAPGEGFEKRERAPSEASGEKRSFDRPARRAPGEGFEKRERAPREASGEKRSYDRPARRPPGEGFDKRERAPREASGEKRSFDRPARRAPGEGFEKRERAPRSDAGERRSAERPPRRAPGEGDKRPPRGAKPSGGKPPRSGGAPRGGKGPPRKPRGG
jgi:23S rRNA pseudouridine2605 synthase